LVSKSLFNGESLADRTKDNARSLVFPNEREVERKEKVTIEAMDLINSLLQEREYRLSSRKYRLNDWQHSRRIPGQLVAKRADPQAKDYKGHFVYPDDATDIKNHAFFDRIDWDRLHLTRPPFVPEVSSRDDTKYFDEEEPISDVDDAASQSIEEATPADERRGECSDSDRVTQVDGAPGHDVKIADSGAEATKENKSAKAKTTKRPRDRVLRDKEVGRKALELRKKGAFLGYTYRRPKLLSFDDERGRQRAARRSLIPSFDREP